ncbi:MAG TPA: hypothetical protein VFT71_06555 [Candidatus Nitrosocosmicus sp.]|nr:hypothetical protein [Candidatus Nitrosocosmicus sp.]
MTKLLDKKNNNTINNNNDNDINTLKRKPWATSSQNQNKMDPLMYVQTRSAQEEESEINIEPSVESYCK